VVEEVRARLAAEGAQVTTLDGLRVREGGGWWLLRASNTEDALTLRCEAPDEAGLKALTARLAAQLEASGLTPPRF
jgi:phosphomannomutase